jgi:parvulin-like peptidyl-prolyl isomerase
MLKFFIYSTSLLIASVCWSQETLETELDSINDEVSATKFIETHKSNKGKIITFNKEKHNTRLANELFDLNKGGKKTYKTDIDKTHYKVIDKVKIPYYRVSYIFLDGKEKSIDEINTLRSEIIAKYNDGFPFKNLAKRYSMDNNANRGGDLGWFTNGDMVLEFEEAVINSNSNVGDIFTVDIENKNWYYVILKTYDTKMIEEIKVLKLTESIE